MMPDLFIPGLVSITFRQLKPIEVISLVSECGLKSIEWGGDVHVPHGDVSIAREVRQMTADAGLAISAYGSYYRLAATEAAKSPSFEKVLDSAVALGAPSVRVWAGTLASVNADSAYRRAVTDDLLRIAALAAEQKLTIDLEYHPDTLTDTPETVVELLKSVASATNVRSYWQARHAQPVEQHLADIEQLQPWLANVHAFHWWPGWSNKHPLADGADRWTAFLTRLSTIGSSPRHVSLEFVKGDSPDQLRQDAKTLHSLIAATQS